MTIAPIRDNAPRSTSRRRRRLGWIVAPLVAVGLAVGSTPATAQVAPAAAPACSSLENCYGYEDMPVFYEQVTVLLDEFSRASYADMPAPRDYMYIPSGMTATTSCGEPADATAFQLCTADDTIYIGQDRLWAFYSRQGDAAAAFGISHEWGHHLQTVAGVMDRATTRFDGIRMENQADCVGGAFLGFLDSRGQIEPDDYDDINAVLPVIASAEGPDRDHGTLAERDASAQYGLDNGLASCNAYFPQTPLLTP